MKKTKVVVIGSGPAGYTAALYMGRAQLEPVVYAGGAMGGQLMLTTEVENFPGFPEGVNGPDLMIAMRAQAERFEAVIVDEYITAVDFSVRPFRLWTGLPAGMSFASLTTQTDQEWQTMTEQIKSESHTIEAEAVVIATGAEAIHLGVKGELALTGRGVSTCAVCDAAFFKGKTTFVVGGGDAAMEDSLALSKFAESVTIIHRRAEFRASKIMQDRVLKHPKIKVLWNTELKEIMGEKKVEKVKIVTEGSQGQTALKELPADGVFVAIGHKPMTKLFRNQLNLDQHGYVVTRQSLSQLGVQSAQQALSPEGLVAFPTSTSVEGVFAAGDVVDIRYWQAIAAAGQGCQAAIDAERWLEGQS